MNLKKITYIIIIISSIIILITIGIYIHNDFFNPFYKLNTEKLGHFGDFIGGFVGVILTFLATILIYFTYDSQKKELALNSKLFAIQNFENTFFNMLKVHQEIRKEISFKKNTLGISSHHISIFLFETDVQGKKAIEVLSNDLKYYWNVKKEEKLISENDVIDIYNVFWEKYANDLGDYFRNLYHILKFISEEKASEISNNNSKEKAIIVKKYRKYADILQSQMSFSELFLFYYNALKFNRVKKYIKEFDFVENLHSGNLLPNHTHFKGMGNLKND